MLRVFDQILMDNYLLILKSTVEVYVHGTLESSNKNVEATLKLGLEETIKHQSRTYQKMTEYGWYQIQNVETKEIKKTLKKLQQKNN